MNKQSILIGDKTKLIDDWLKNIEAQKILFITGKRSFESSGSREYLLPIIKSYNHVYFSDFEQNPQIEDVSKGIEIYKNEECDCCIAVGGGSVIDMSKLVSYLGKYDKVDYSELIKKNELSLLNREIPLCVIPTTAGSGAESTHFAVVYIDGKKHSLTHKTILPDLVNLNPKLSFTTNKYLKAITGIDALAQGIESFWSKNATKQSRIYSSEAIELVWNNLKKSVINNDIEAHYKVVKGSNLAGKAINIAKTTACHAISYYFTTTHNINHGHAVALTLGKVYEFNNNKALKSENEIKFLFVHLNNLLKISNTPNADINAFILDLNIELDYSKLNIDISKELPRIIKGVNLERLSNNPFTIEENDFKKLILNN